MDTHCAKIWGPCLSYLEDRVQTESFHTWLRPVHLVALDGDTATIGAPNKFVADWVQSRYGHLIDEALEAVTGHPWQHRIEVHPGGNGQRTDSDLGTNGPREVPTADPEPSPLPRRSLSDARARAQISPRFTFGNFVVGESNQLAHAASLAVAQMPGRTKYNPLFIYGSVGLGKTHLAQAIGNEVLENDPHSGVLYVTSEKFTNDFIDSLSKRKTAEFVGYYRSADVLLIDDIQFLAGKESTQEQFFHTFNTLHQNGKQIVLTADRPPGEIKGLEERLLSRFQWGLAADIGPPDFETRVAILKKKLEGEDVILPNDVLVYIARSAHANIRQLEGALVRLLAVSSLNGTAISLSIAKDVLRDTLSKNRKPITIPAIRATVATFFGIPEPLLSSKRRTQEVATARQVAMYIARTLTSTSLKMIGAEFGGRDHSTVIHAVNVVRDSIKSDAELKLRVDQTISALYSPGHAP